MQAAGDDQRRNERLRVVRALVDKARHIPEHILVSDDGSRALELESALVALQRAADEANGASARAALAAAQGGDARVAEQWFLASAQASAHGTGEERREAASAYRHLAALASLHDRAKASEALRRAVSLAPDDPALWARLGHAVTPGSQAEAAYRRAIELSTGMVERDPTVANATKRNLAIALSNLACWILGPTRGVEAEALHRRALQLYEELGDREGLARQSTTLGGFYRSRAIKVDRDGRVIMSRRELDDAAAHWARALTLYTELDDKVRIAELVGLEGLIAKDRGHLTEAESSYLRALALAKECDDRKTIIEQLNGLFALYSSAGKRDDAHALLARLNRERRHVPLGFFEIDELMVRGARLLHAGDADAASECFERARDRYDNLGQSEGMARSLAGLRPKRISKTWEWWPRRRASKIY